MAKYAEICLAVIYLVDLYKLKLSVFRQWNLVVPISSVVLFFKLTVYINDYSLACSIFHALIRSIIYK